MNDKNNRVLLLTSTSGDIYITTPNKNILLENMTIEEENKFNDYDGIIIKPKHSELEEAYYEIQKYLGSTLVYFRIENNSKSRCNVMLTNINILFDKYIELEYLELSDDDMYNDLIKLLK